MKFNQTALSILLASVFALGSAAANANIFGIEGQPNYWSVNLGMATAAQSGSTNASQPILIGGSFGAYLSSNLSVAVDLMSLGGEKESGNNYSSTLTRNSLGVSATYRLPVSEKIKLFGRGGLAYAKSDIIFVMNKGVTTQLPEIHDSAIVPVLNAGAEFDLSDRNTLSAGVEYISSASNNPLFSSQIGVKLGFARRF